MLESEVENIHLETPSKMLRLGHNLALVCLAGSYTVRYFYKWHNSHWRRKGGGKKLLRLSSPGWFTSLTQTPNTIRTAVTSAGLQRLYEAGAESRHRISWLSRSLRCDERSIAVRI
ncbi:hypothetical protein PoB_007668300 [Plakobranchus ocellatus]|uniref:Uncharacterized protein n=1 Tax=Plakobranchus ocellatus TaxID=259542 RepID=A0AAV4E0V1_9GAST|nr:hypothetical protein PoB_007668300 [Plakobranchus ocellatus]